MAINKKGEFATNDQRLSEVAKALSHPARISILRILAEHPQYTCGEIVAILPLAQPTVSRHLKELHTAGLITIAANGKHSMHEINWKRWKTDAAAFGQLLGITQEG